MAKKEAQIKAEAEAKAKYDAKVDAAVEAKLKIKAEEEPKAAKSKADKEADALAEERARVDAENKKKVSDTEKRFEDACAAGPLNEAEKEELIGLERKAKQGRQQEQPSTDEMFKLGVLRERNRKDKS